MKRVIVLTALAALAALAGGCASTGLHFDVFPVARVMVVNDCPAAEVIVLNSPYLKEVRVPYGELRMVKLERMIGSDDRIAVKARGFGGEEYLGSAERYFYVSPYTGSTQEAWQIQYLSGGKGCGRAR